jgi:hypothetical protein
MYIFINTTYHKQSMQLNMYSAFTFVLDQSRLWKFGELYGKTVAE